MAAIVACTEVSSDPPSAECVQMLLVFYVHAPSFPTTPNQPRCALPLRQKGFLLMARGRFFVFLAAPSAAASATSAGGGGAGICMACP